MDVELADTLNQQWKNDKNTFAFRMMQKMGWKEDKGLGKNETGITDNVRASKREIGLGLGMEESADGAGNKAWSETAGSFNAVLEVLKASYGKKSKKKKSEKTSKVPTISVGMKYKKHSEAKNLSNKSLADKRAIFGASMDYSQASAAVTSSNTDSSDVFSKIKGLSAITAEESGSDSDSEKEKKKKSSKKSKKSKKD